MTFYELEEFVRKAIDYHNNNWYHSSIDLKATARFVQEQLKYLAESNAFPVS